jgi:hypothetical protein
MCHARIIIAAEQVATEAIESLRERRRFLFLLAVCDTAKQEQGHERGQRVFAGGHERIPPVRFVMGRIRHRYRPTATAG